MTKIRGYISSWMNIICGATSFPGTFRSHRNPTVGSTIRILRKFFLPAWPTHISRVLINMSKNDVLYNYVSRSTFLIYKTWNANNVLVSARRSPPVYAMPEYGDEEISRSVTPISSSVIIICDSGHQVPREGRDSLFIHNNIAAEPMYEIFKHLFPIDLV